MLIMSKVSKTVSSSPGRRRSWCSAAAAMLGCMLAGTVGAQTAPSARPQPAPAAIAAPKAAAQPAARTRIELPASERAALEASAAPATPPPPPARNELLPQPEDAQLTIIEPSGTVVEQIRQSNRISEVRVTPALTGHTWVMTNREGRQPLSPTDTHSGLSVPKFFTFEFGGGSSRTPAPNELPAAPPPPSSQSR